MSFHYSEFLGISHGISILDSFAEFRVAFLDQSQTVSHCLKVNQTTCGKVSCCQVFRLSQHLELVLVLLLDGVAWWAHTNYVKTSCWINSFCELSWFPQQNVIFPWWKTTARRVKKSEATGIAYLQGSEGLSDFASVVARSLGEADRPWIFFCYNGGWVVEKDHIRDTGYITYTWHDYIQEHMHDSMIAWHVEVHEIRVEITKCICVYIHNFKKTK